MQKDSANETRKKVLGKTASFFFVIVCVIIIAATTIAIRNISLQKQNAAVPLIGTPSVEKPNDTWKSIFDDEFNGNSLDTTKWTTCYHSGNCTNSGNDEREWYFANNVSVSNGILTLQAEKKKYTAPDGKTYDYASGMISSVHFSFKYGYVEMRAKVAAGKGMWSAFWTLPVNGGWPPEFDVHEIIGSEPRSVQMNYHYGTSDNNTITTWQGPDFSVGWHTFGMDWEPNAITWYIDGIERKKYTDPATITNEPMYLLANLAVGGRWPGLPDATTAFPGKYEIDYIKVWQKQATSLSIPVRGAAA